MTTTPPDEIGPAPDDPVAVYATAPRGTVHLIPGLHELRTLCGKPASPSQDWELGDETLSGSVATCQTCLRAFRR